VVSEKQFYFIRRKQRRIDLKTASGGLKLIFFEILLKIHNIDDQPGIILDFIVLEDI